VIAPLRAAAGLILAAALTTGCTSTGSGPAAASAPPSEAVVAAAGPSLPACAHAGPAVDIPADFPASFPLPDGSLVVGADTPAGGGVRIKVIVPLEVDAFGQFLERSLPAAGLAIGGGEAEADELESKFSGAGLAGQLTAREMAGCPGMLDVQVAVRAT
jgi:hypothetical protein